MASIIGQNIGGNPRGILNLGSTINTPLDTTLRNVTDGLGNNSPLQLSTTQVTITSTFSTTAVSSLSNGVLYVNTSNWANIQGRLGIGFFGDSSARLHVRGDGTNPIVRFENSSGSNAWAITSGGTALTCEGQARIQGPAIANDSSVVLGSYNNLTTTSLTQTILNIQGNIVCAAGSGNKRISSIEYGINNSGAQTGTATGIFLNATETALNGMTHNLMDLQVGGVSRFKFTTNTSSTQPILQVIDSSGALISGFTRFGGVAVSNAIIFGTAGSGTFTSNGSRIYSTSDGILRFLNNSENGFTMLQFGGTSNAFPAIKRSGTTLLARYADDSGYAYFESNAINITHNEGDAALRFIKSGSNQFSIEHDTARIYWYNSTTAKSVFNISNNGSIVIGGVNPDAGASALFQMDSTTKGFLPPRMTTAQKTAIGTPDTGLVVYDTTLNKLCVYTTAWETVTSV